MGLYWSINQALVSPIICKMFSEVRYYDLYHRVPQQDLDTAMFVTSLGKIRALIFDL